MSWYEVESWNTIARTKDEAVNKLEEMKIREP